MNNICYFCHESVGAGDPVWIMEKEKPKQVLRCPQCDKQKESVVARIIGELMEIDFMVRPNESSFGQGLRLCYEVIIKVTEWRNLLNKEDV